MYKHMCVYIVSDKIKNDLRFNIIYNMYHYITILLLLPYMRKSIKLMINDFHFYTTFRSAIAHFQSTLEWQGRHFDVQFHLHTMILIVFFHFHDILQRMDHQYDENFHFYTMLRVVVVHHQSIR